MRNSGRPGMRMGSPGPGAAGGGHRRAGAVGQGAGRDGLAHGGDAGHRVDGGDEGAAAAGG
ncbi:MAG TPA: hypothetical protein PKC36_03045, partial [Dietzia sp.]|nr:hypothetical protein [Dietzia sp.]